VTVDTFRGESFRGRIEEIAAGESSLLATFKPAMSERIKYSVCG
jgi:hypothetical protein